MCWITLEPRVYLKIKAEFILVQKSDRKKNKKPVILFYKTWCRPAGKKVQQNYFVAAKKMIIAMNCYSILHAANYSSRLSAYR